MDSAIVPDRRSAAAAERMDRAESTRYETFVTSSRDSTRACVLGLPATRSVGCSPDKPVLLKNSFSREALAGPQARLYSRLLLVRRTDQQHLFVWAAPYAPSPEG